MTTIVVFVGRCNRLSHHPGLDSEERPLAASTASPATVNVGGTGSDEAELLVTPGARTGLVNACGTRRGLRPATPGSQVRSGREQEDAHRILGRASHLVSAGGAAHEANGVAFDELPLSLRRPRGRLAAEDD
jgi:hypothetical protein